MCHRSHTIAVRYSRIFQDLNKRGSSWSLGCRSAPLSAPCSERKKDHLGIYLGIFLIWTAKISAVIPAYSGSQGLHISAVIHFFTAQILAVISSIFTAYIWAIITGMP